MRVLELINTWYARAQQAELANLYSAAEAIRECANELRQAVETVETEGGDNDTRSKDPA